MPSFPGSQKNKIEFFIHRLYQGHEGEKLSKSEIMPKVQAFPFAPDEQVFFEELPDRSYSQKELVKALNDIMQRRGRVQAMGGLLDIRNVEHPPAEWEEAFHRIYERRK